jgi:hypothetical protein
MATINVPSATAYNASHRDADAEKAIALLVARWQEQQKLDVDGKLGPATQKAIFAQLAEPAIDPAVLEGDHGEPGEADAQIAIDDDGWADGDGVSRIPSARSQNLRTRDASNRPAPVGVVWHWTATGPGTGWACARRIALAPAAGERAASWHTLITRTGEILCSVPFRRGSWHAGGASAARFGLKNKRWDIVKGADASANSLMIGIELENVGEVRQLKDGRWSGWPFGEGGKNGPMVPEADTIVRGKKRYHNFPEAQETAARRLLRAIVEEYGLDEQAVSWSHLKIDPTRKSDPGPVWLEMVLPRMIDAIY